MEKFTSLAQILAAKGLLPFFMLGTIAVGGNNREGNAVNFNVARIIEALIIALITAMLTAYVTVKDLQKEVSFIKERQAEMCRITENRQNEIKSELNRLRDTVESKLLK